MRIVSQDGKIDLPYENMGVLIKKGKISLFSYMPHCIWEMATYSTEAKAKKATEILQNAYLYSPIADELSVYNTTQTNRIFQFPADEDVEV